MEAALLEAQGDEPNIIVLDNYVLPPLNLDDDTFQEIIFLENGLGRILNEFDMVPSVDQMALILEVIRRLESLGITRKAMLNFLKERYLYPWINGNGEIVDFTVSLD